MNRYQLLANYRQEVTKQGGVPTRQYNLSFWIVGLSAETTPQGHYDVYAVWIVLGNGWRPVELKAIVPHNTTETFPSKLREPSWREFRNWLHSQYPSGVPWEWSRCIEGETGDPPLSDAEWELFESSHMVIERAKAAGKEPTFQVQTMTSQPKQPDKSVLPDLKIEKGPEGTISAEVELSADQALEHGVADTTEDLRMTQDVFDALHSLPSMFQLLVTSSPETPERCDAALFVREIIRGSEAGGSVKTGWRLLRKLADVPPWVYDQIATFRKANSGDARDPRIVETEAEQLVDGIIELLSTAGAERVFQVLRGSTFMFQKKNPLLCGERGFTCMWNAIYEADVTVHVRHVAK